MTMYPSHKVTVVRNHIGYGISGNRINAERFITIS